MAKGDKFGSPFDPRNFGKVPRDKMPKKMQEDKKPPVQFNLGGGCGDPTCAACYPPEVNRAAALGGANRMATTGRSPFSSLSREYERLREEMARGTLNMSPGAINRVEMNVNRVRIPLPDGRMWECAVRADEPVERQIYYAAQQAGLDPTMVLRSWAETANMQQAYYNTAPPPRTPPESYVRARKEVEDFIRTADKQAFEDIVGNEEALVGLIDAIKAPVKHKALYKAYGMKMPKGAVLTGPPGCGKTMFARAAATKFKELYKSKDEDFISIQSTDIQSMFVGVTEQHIRNVFAYGREYKAYHGHPLLVFIDEAEILFPDRTGRVRRVTPWEESQVATFLAEMDGIQESGVFMLLATNRMEVMDSALLRDGRCDFKIVVKRPTRENAEIILQKNFVHTFAKDDRDTLAMAAVESLYAPHYILNTAAQVQANFEKKEISVVAQRDFLLEDIVSGAMLASIPQRATRYAFARDKESGVATGVTTADVLRAVKDIYEENEPLEHPYAQREFMEKFAADLKEKE